MLYPTPGLWVTGSPPLFASLVFPRDGRGTLSDIRCPVCTLPGCSIVVNDATLHPKAFGPVSGSLFHSNCMLNRATSPAHAASLTICPELQPQPPCRALRPRLPLPHSSPLSSRVMQTRSLLHLNPLVAPDCFKNKVTNHEHVKGSVIGSPRSLRPLAGTPHWPRPNTSLLPSALWISCVLCLSTSRAGSSSSFWAQPPCHLIRKACPTCHAPSCLSVNALSSAHLSRSHYLACLSLVYCLPPLPRVSSIRLACFPPSLLYPQCQIQCLVHSRGSINSHGVNK